jgi:hypothetical protein
MSPATRQVCFINAASFSNRAAASRHANPGRGAGSAR